MKTIEFRSNYGNFDYRMTAEVGEELTAATEALAAQGLANICYRVAGSSVDKALGAKDRKAVLFSDADGEKINAAVSAKINAMLAAEKTKVLQALKLSFAVTGEHVFGESADAPSKEATEMWTKVQGLAPEHFALALKALGLDEEYTDESGILACKRKLQEAKAKAKAETLALVGVGVGAA